MQRTYNKNKRYLLLKYVLTWAHSMAVNVWVSVCIFSHVCARYSQPMLYNIWAENPEEKNLKIQECLDWKEKEEK